MENPRVNARLQKAELEWGVDWVFRRLRASHTATVLHTVQYDKIIIKPLLTLLTARLRWKTKARTSKFMLPFSDDEEED